MFKRLKSHVRRLIWPALHKPKLDIEYSVLGSSYGGWPVVRALTQNGVLVYSFGIGEDISFDLAMIEHYSANVHAFDPTPRCLKWIEQQSIPAQFQFHAIGISDTDCEIEFYAPEVADHVSFSAAPAKRSNLALSVKAPVRRLQTIINDLNTPVPDILKMDIEGFEYGVIKDLLSTNIRPTQLLIEFHHYMYDIKTERTLAAVAELQAAGYEIFHVSESGHEYGLVNSQILE
jgi:FkbM family methyltransferase